MLEIRLFATLRDGRGKVLMVEKGQMERCGDVLDWLQIPPEDVAIFLINGFHKKPEDRISDGDVLAIFPPVGGG